MGETFLYQIKTTSQCSFHEIPLKKPSLSSQSTNQPILKLSQINYKRWFPDRYCSLPLPPLKQNLLYSSTGTHPPLQTPCGRLDPTLNAKRWVPSSLGKKNHRRPKLLSNFSSLNRTFEKHSLVLKNITRERRMEYRLSNSGSKLIPFGAG